MVRKLVFLLVVFFCGIVFADGPCYYRITVDGECKCDSPIVEGCPEGVTGEGIYKKYSSSEVLYPILSALEESWVFLQDGTMFSINTCEELIFCEGIIQNQGQYADPNFLVCGSGEGSFVFDVFGYDADLDRNIAKYEVTIEALCSCEEYINILSAMGPDPNSPDNACNCDCDTDPACGVEEELADNQGDIKPDSDDSGGPEPGINDPVSPASGKLYSSITDITLPGRMMDINLTRTYRGDMDDPGFTHTFYSPAAGQKILIGSNFVMDRPQEYDFPIAGDFYSSTGGTVSHTSLDSYTYTFMQINSVDWEFDNDCFNIDTGDPNDPNNTGIVTFDDYDSGETTVTTRYCVYGTNDPNGGNPLIYFNSHPEGDISTVYSRTFDYELDGYSCRFGNKWDHNYNIFLDFVFDPNEDAPKKYAFGAGNGKRLMFVQEPETPFGESSVYRCPSDTSEILYSTENGFQLHRKGGTIYKFGSDLKISAIEDLNGNQITFTYSNGNLYQVTNDIGNYIRFYYDSLNMIDHITDNFGRTWYYDRDSDFDLVSVTKPITGTSGNITNTYTYDDDHNLLTMTDGADQTWQSNIYTDGRISAQAYGTGYFNNTYYFRQDDPNIVDHVLTNDRNGNNQTMYLTKTGLIRQKVVDLGGGEYATTEYTYDFDATGAEELESECLVTEIEMPAGDIYEFDYDSWGNLTSRTHKTSETDAGITTSYTYTNNIFSLPASITDGQGNTTSFTYDTSFNLTKITLPQIDVSDPNNPGTLQPINPEYEFTYNTYGQVENVYLPDDTKVHYGYDGDGFVSDVVYDYGTSEQNQNITYSFTYDSRGNIASVTDPDNIVTGYDYDNINRLIEISDALNSKIKLSYNDASLVEGVSRQLGASFNENTAISSSFTYNSVDKLTSITDSLGWVTQFTLDNNDNIEEAADAQGLSDGYSTLYSYNVFDQVASVTKPEDYDIAAGNQNITSIDYTVDGLTETVTDAAGEETNYYYDGYRRLIKVEYPDLSSEEYTYDDNGSVLSETKRDGSAIYYNYDSLGRLIDKGVDAAGGEDIIATTNTLLDGYMTTGTWTATTDSACIGGRYVTTTEPNATYTLFGNEAGRFAVLVRYPSFGASSNSEAKVLFGNRLEPDAEFVLDQSSGGDSWVYVGAGEFEGLPQVTIYSNGSSDITSIDAVKFVPVKSFEYDAVGRITKAGTNTFTYDSAGRLTSETDGFGREVSYEYTAAGRRSKLTWPDGFYVTYGYDACGRLNAVYSSNSSVLWSCSYDSAGRRVQTTGVYGLVTDYDYEDVSSTVDDDRGLYLDSIENTLGSLSLDFDYSRDLAGNITTEESEGTEIDYLYDKNYSLTDVDYETGYDIAFDYDNLLNRVSVVEGTSTTNYTKYTNGLNQYSTIGAASLEYDDNCNLTQYGTWYYLYNCENQMIATYNLTGDPNEVVVSLYGYDEFGRRTNKASAVGVESTTGSISESYVYDGFQVIGEYDTDGLHIKRRFIYAAGIDEPICMVVEPQHQGWYGLDEFKTIAYSWLCEDGDACYNSEYDLNTDDIIDSDDLSQFASDYYLDDRPFTENTKYYGYVFDGTGNVVAMTYCNDPNETGNPNEQPYFVETYKYDPFGAVTIYDPNGISLTDSAIGNPYMFTGRRYDSESGLYYYRYRMYSPELGRFMQTDPIGYYDSMNLYQYCRNNPINYSDPMGLYPHILEQYLTQKPKRRKPPHQASAAPGAEGSRENPHPLTRDKLKDKVRSLAMPRTPIEMLWFDPGSYYNHSGHYYTYNGKKYRGEEVNYIGVGAAAAHFGCRSGAAIPNTFSVMFHYHKASGNEIMFFNLGFELYEELHPNNSKSLPPYTWPIY